MAISEKFKAPEYSFKNNDTKDKLTFSIFNGELYVSIWGQNGQKNLSEKLTLSQQRRFVKLITKVKDGSPGEKKGMSLSKYDFKGTKAWIPSFGLVVEKDNDQIFVIHVKVPRGDASNTFAFKIMDNGGVTIDGENVSKPASSLQAIDTLLYWMDHHVPVGMVLTKEKWTGNTGGGGGQAAAGGNSDMPF